MKSFLKENKTEIERTCGRTGLCSRAIIDETSWHIHFQDHGRLQVHMFKPLNSCVNKNI